MRVYAVSYDLNRPGQNYQGLIGELEQSPSWWHYLKSTWLIATNETPDQLWGRLEPHVDTTDCVLIMEVINRAQGWLPAKAWEWINQYVRAAA